MSQERKRCTNNSAEWPVLVPGSGCPQARGLPAPGPAGHVPNSRSVGHAHPQRSVVGGTRSASPDATSTCLPRVEEAVSCPPGRHTPGPGGSGQGQGGKSAGPDRHEDLGSLLAENMELNYQMGPLKERVCIRNPSLLGVRREIFTAPYSLPPSEQPKSLCTQICEHPGSPYDDDTICHSCTAHRAPGILSGVLKIQLPLILTSAHWRYGYHFHFTDEATETTSVVTAHCHLAMNSPGE